MKLKNNLSDNDLTNILSKVLKIKKENISKDISRNNCKVWDSMNHVRIMLELEKTTSLKIDSNDAIDLDSYESIIEHFRLIEK